MPKGLQSFARACLRRRSLARSVRRDTGAAAALAGLVFVAVSINIARILTLPGVPERGLQTVLLLLGTVVAGLFGRAPHFTTALGIELIGLGSALAIFLALTTPGR